MLPHPELYNLALDSGEGYDVAKEHPEVVQEIFADVEEQLQHLPDGVREGYKALQLNVAAHPARPRATGRMPLPSWAWEPPERR